MLRTTSDNRVMVVRPPIEDDSPPPGDGARREIVRLLSENNRRIYAYLYTMLGNADDAEDLLQETCLTIWDKTDEFKPGTNFMAWALRIASHKAMNLIRKKGRAKVLFDQDVFESVARDASEITLELDARHDALRECMKKLQAQDRQILRSRYQEGATVASIATTSGRSVHAIYRALKRIHTALFDCVSRRVTTG